MSVAVFFLCNLFYRIDVNLRRTVLCTAIRNGGLKEYQLLERKYKASDLSSEKSTLRYALSCSKDVKIIQR